MLRAISSGHLPPSRQHTLSCRSLLSQLGKSLGQLDLAGQLRGLAAAQEACRKELERVEAEKAGRLRCYRALGLCAGAALAILLL